jgi:tetratricopeptide (TPR) repeat protein
LADHDHDESGISQAFSDADRGIQLAPEYPEAYQVRAFLRGAHNLDMVGAEADVQRALSLDPTNSLVLTSYAQILAARGNVVDAIAAAQRALSTDPLQFIAWGNLGSYFLALGNYAMAREAAEHVRQIDPESIYLEEVIPLSYLLGGQPQRALDLGQQFSDPEDKLFVIAMAEQALARPDATQDYARFIQQYSQDEYAVAQILGFRGDITGALEWLRRARSEHRDVRKAQYDPLLRKVRADPRYQQLLTEWKIN